MFCLDCLGLGFANVACGGFRFNSLLHDDTDFWIPTSSTTTYTNMSDTEQKPADEVMAGEDETNEEVSSPLHPSTNTHTCTHTQRERERDRY